MSSMVPSLLPWRNSTEILVSSVTAKVTLLPEDSNVLPPIPPGASPSGLSGAFPEPSPESPGALPESSPSGFAGGSPSGLSELSPELSPLSPGFSGAEPPSPGCPGALPETISPSSAVMEFPSTAVTFTVL